MKVAHHWTPTQQSLFIEQKIEGGRYVVSVWNSKRNSSGVGPRLPSGVVLRPSQACCVRHVGTGQPSCLRATVDSPPSHRSSACLQLSPCSGPWILLNAEMRKSRLASLGYFCFKCLTLCRNIGSVSVASCQGFAAVFSVVKWGGWHSQLAAVEPGLLSNRLLSSSTMLFLPPVKIFPTKTSPIKYEIPSLSLKILLPPQSARVGWKK